MFEAWATAVPSVLIGITLLILPGAAVVFAGWGARDLRIWLLAPAISIALIAASSTVAHIVGLRWSIGPVALVTLVCAGVALAVRRWVSAPANGADEATSTPPAASPRWAAAATATVGLLAATLLLSSQLASVFGDPENISQTFDNVVHMNAIRLALDSGDASIFGIGSTSDIDWYPNAWHSVVTLVAQLGGGSVPLAINAANIAICAFAWPASVMSLVATLFRARPAALAAAAAVSTGFGAFPLLLLYFGVLYPNATAYAVLPAGIAAVWMLLRSRSRDIVRHSLLVVLVGAGIGLAHPNAFLALYALTLGVVIWYLVRTALRSRTRHARWTLVIASTALLLVGAGLWRFARTNAEMSGWAAWQSTAQAFGEAALISPRGYPITAATAVLLIVGMVAVARRPSRWFWVGVPFATAAFLFIVVSGIPVGTVLRNLITNPWYNDSYRLAALLPAAGIPVAVLGATVLVDLVAVAWRRMRLAASLRRPIIVIALSALFTVAMGSNVSAVMADARLAYRLDESSALLTSNEADLLSRLEDSTTADALLIVNPWTGGSLAFALADRDVTAMHVFGTRTADQEFIDGHLNNIDSDPRVCEAIDRVGADYVLDFGDQNVFNAPGSGLERAGLNNLAPSSHLVLIDSQGADARLFAIEGC